MVKKLEQIEIVKLTAASVVLELSSPIFRRRLQSRFHQAVDSGRIQEPWKRMLAYATGTVNHQALLLRNENPAEDFGVIKLSQTFRFNLGSIKRPEGTWFRSVCDTIKTT